MWHVTTFYGLLGGVIGRIAWANGYASGRGPGARYRAIAAQAVWLSLLGLLINCLLIGINMLRSFKQIESQNA